MSSIAHPKLELWNRDEHGSYSAEIEGWKLVVRWRPESPGRRRGFWFEATPPKGPKILDSEIHEEIEIAMSHGEAVVAERTAPRAQTSA